MSGPDIALAASARDWPDRLHRFLLDHGGGRIARKVMSHEQALEGGFDVLVIDDVCSFLTPRLVSMVKQSGVDIVGVFVPEDGADAKRRLLECGIVDVIETEAAPEEFLAEIVSVRQHRDPTERAFDRSPRGLTIGVTGAVAGSGITEVAIAVALAISETCSTVLIDADQDWPAVAQRLDLPLHPNIRTALDHALHTPQRLSGAMLEVADLLVVGGRADDGQAPPVGRGEVLTLLDASSAIAEVVVTDLGTARSAGLGLLGEFDTLLLVGTCDPVGMARLIKVATGILGAGHGQSLLIVLNRVSNKGFERDESVAELGRAVPDVPVTVVRADPKVERAAWDGKQVPAGRFRKAARAIAGVVTGAVK